MGIEPCSSSKNHEHGQTAADLRADLKRLHRDTASGHTAVATVSGPIRYGSGRKAKTRSADPLLIQKARRFGVRPLMRASGASQHATERFLRGERVHPGTRARL